MGAMLAMKTTNTELESVRYYLRQWVRWQRHWRPNIGAPRAVPYLHSIRPTYDSYTELEDYDDKIHAEVMRQVDQAIRRDLTTDHMHSILVIHMREIGPAVWQSGKKPMTEIRRLCAEAEEKLVPLLRRRDVAL
jgi:hypothetical protein